MPGSGEFEVCENGAQVVSGRVSSPSEPVRQFPIFEPSTTPADSHLIQLTSGDIYKELKLRGYDYGPTFQGIMSTSNYGDSGYLKWNDNWVSFLDTMLQIQVLSLPGHSMRLPTRIKEMHVNPSVHQQELIEVHSECKAVKVLVDSELDICTAGGVQILGLHATVAPKRQQQQATPVLEEFHFIPYIEQELNHSTNLINYLQKSLAFVKKSLNTLLENGITEKLPNVELLKKVEKQITVDDNVEKIEEDGTLLNMLTEMFSQTHDNNFTDNIRNVVEANKTVLAEDKLMSNMLCPRSLKTTLDVVLENCGAAKLKVVEVTDGKSPVFQKVINQLNTQPMLCIDYTVTGPSLDGLDEALIESLDVKPVPWDLTAEPPGQLASADVVIFSSTLHNQTDIPAILEHIQSIIKQEGFVLIHEPTENFSIHLSLQGLTQDYTSITDRTCGPFCNQADWINIFHQAGFQVVAQKSDQLLFTLFLLKRNDKEMIMKPTIIYVDDPSYSWVDEVKTAMEEVTKPEDRIYLISESVAHSGIVGMVNCLRQESGGAHLRCIFNTNLSKDSQITQHTSSSSISQSILQKDLVMNVFRDGEWGSFRHIPVSSSGNTVKTQHAYVNVLTRGDLSSLKWIESPVRYFSAKDNPTKQLCSVYYTSLNFRDILLATGKLSPDAIPGDIATQDCILGMEFSGRDDTGNKIMGLLPAKVSNVQCLHML